MSSLESPLHQTVTDTVKSVLNHPLDHSSGRDQAAFSITGLKSSKSLMKTINIVRTRCTAILRGGNLITLLKLRFPPRNQNPLEILIVFTGSCKEIQAGSSNFNRTLATLTSRMINRSLCPLRRSFKQSRSVHEEAQKIREEKEHKHNGQKNRLFGDENR
jgi:hypothetical protein